MADLQPVLQAATVGAAGCNRRCPGLQNYVPRAAELREYCGAQPYVSSADPKWWKSSNPISARGKTSHAHETAAPGRSCSGAA